MGKKSIVHAVRGYDLLGSQKESEVLRVATQFALPFHWRLHILVNRSTSNELGFRHPFFPFIAGNEEPRLAHVGAIMRQLAITYFTMLGMTVTMSGKIIKITMQAKHAATKKLILRKIVVSSISGASAFTT